MKINERLIAASAAFVAAAAYALIARLKMGAPADAWGSLCGAHQGLAHCGACYAALAFAGLGLALLAAPIIQYAKAR
ncbi:MAG TPA: hypothetical protein VF138_07775 [Caulobacteraceae bacterium]